MSITNSKIKPFPALIFLFLFIITTSFVSASETAYQLDNGMEIILKENHSSPMIAVMVFVKSGSKYESQFENGITHFLEHLLFDGTVNLSREEIDLSIRNLGGYINAFTRDEMTAYLVLLPKQYIDYGMTVQADMLFNSIFPDVELTKERKVVIEEINRDKDSEGYAAEKFFSEYAYANTEYSKPVLGYNDFIDNIPKEAIIDYWKRFYTPENMTVLVIGDFEIESMTDKVQNVFGKIAKNSSTAVEQIEDLPESYGKITGENVYDTVASVKSTYIKFSFNAPHYTDSNYLAVDLLSQYLGMDDISPLMIALKNGSDPLATNASVYLTTYQEFSRLEVSVITDKPDKSSEIVSTIIDQIANAGEHTADNEALEGIKTSIKTSDVYNSEKLHYLGFMIGQQLMVSGWDFVKTYADNISKVSWSDCQAAAEIWYQKPEFIGTVVKPATETQTVYSPYEMAAEDVTAHFASVTFPQYNLDSAVALVYPQTDSVSFVLEDKAEYHSEVLENGMTLIIKSSPECRVFAMNVIGKNRTGSESEGKAGITDFVNRCIEKGTVTRNAAELNRDLSKIGANVTLYDNPWIPYDDRYTTRRFSFMKFETIDQFAEKGFHLFTEMILHPAFDAGEVEKVRGSMMGILGRNSTSASKIAKNLFYRTMFENNVYDKPIMGSAETISMITAEDLKNYHARFYSPGNIVLSITTGRDVAEVLAWVKSRFGRLTAYAEDFETRIPEKPLVLEMKVNHQELDKEQISIYLGSPLPSANNPDAAAIQVAASILSSRLYLNLREKQGLAYSVGAGTIFDKDFSWYYCSMGTASENYQTALDGIILQIEKLKRDGPTNNELNIARNKIWGRLMSSKLSSINQAYYLAVDAYLKRSMSYDKEYLLKLADVSTESIRRVMSKYFKTDAYVLATAGKKE